MTYKNIYTDYPEYIVLCKANVKLHPCILYINKQNCIHTDITNKTLIFHMEKREKRVEILLSKSTQKVEETMPLKFLFVLLRYLNWFPRYKDSKYP